MRNMWPDHFLPCELFQGKTRAALLRVWTADKSIVLDVRLTHHMERVSPNIIMMLTYQASLEGPDTSGKVS